MARRGAVSSTDCTGEPAADQAAHHPLALGDEPAAVGGQAVLLQRAVVGQAGIADVIDRDRRQAHARSISERTPGF